MTSSALRTNQPSNDVVELIGEKQAKKAGLIMALIPETSNFWVRYS
jgi:hypothetical protein